VITARATGMVQDQLASVLGFFVYVGFRVLPSIHLIVFHLNHMEFGRASIDEVHGDWTRLMGSEVKTERPEPMPFRDRLEVDGVSFVYAAPEDGSEESPARDPSLRDVDLEVRRGESVGIAGSTGAGKSTLVDLLLGLLEPTGGEIRVDGVPIRGRVEAWQRQVGYVPQGVHLIDDTLTRNIALGLRDEEVDAERVAEVARMAQLDELLERLPEGLATVVGERGVRLSGGERQRVAVARALYRDPEVLVLDEATAALDNRTERELTRAIETLRGRKTLIVVAHRLSTVERCDRVVFLRDGRVADTGPFDELLERCADFRAMAGRG
jgi:ATP-binding cassette subfamily C protein